MIKVREASQVHEHLRCAYCHGLAESELWRCDLCNVLLHLDCQRPLRRCMTLGCAARAREHGLASGPRGKSWLLLGFQLFEWFLRSTFTLAFVVGHLGLLAIVGCLLFAALFGR